MKLSVGVVTKNREKSLEELIVSIKNQPYKPFEFIVVENNLIKTLSRLVNSYKKDLPIRYFLEKREGIAYARNKLLKVAKSDVIAFIDDDCTLPNNWIEKILNNFKKNRRVVALLGRSINFYKDNLVADLEQTLYENWLSQYFSISKRRTLNAGIFINTRNFCIKKDLVKKYKLKFDVSAPHKIEDTDFGIRLFKRLNSEKEKILYDPNALVYHKNSTNLLDFLRRRSVSREGVKWLKAKYPNYIEGVIKANPNAGLNLQRKNFLVRVLFFIERQIIRLKALFEKKEFLLKVPSD